MKKFAFSLLIAVIAFSPDISAQRLVLVEEFTGENCGPCAGANPALNALMNANGNKAMLIRYQVPIPTAGPIHNQNTVEPMTRLFYYNCNFAPWGQVDGKVVGSGPYPAMVTEIGQGEIDAAYAVAPPFNITLTSGYNAAKDSVVSTIVLKANTAFSPTGAQLKLRVALLETLHFATPPGSNGETDFEHVVRKMYPGAAGTVLPASWAANQTQTFTVKGPVPTFVNKNNEVLVAVWIQDDANKEVHQAARSANLIPTHIESAAAEVEGAVAVYPNPVHDVLTISLGTQQVSSATAKLLDAAGQVVRTEDWKSGTVSQISLSTTDLPEGFYTVELLMDGVARHSPVLVRHQ